MSTPSLVHAAVEASRAGTDVSVAEDPGRLLLSGVLPRRALLAWQAVVDDRPAWLDLTFVDEARDHVEPRDARDDERLRVAATFVPADGTLHLFTPEGWRSALLDDGRVSSAGEVRLAFLEREFATRAFPVRLWDGTPASGEAVAHGGEAAPRRHVRSQSPDLMPPTRIEPWLAPDRPEAADAAWSSWSTAAAASLMRTLPSELYREGGVDRVVLAGQPTRRLDLGPPEAARLAFEDLQVAASWVYAEGSDIEVRHTFLAAELAREWPAATPFGEGLSGRLPGALDSARLLYKAHLRAGSKDTIKALADLRKTLSDEVGKVTAQAKDLASGVWRDVAVAIGVMAVRFALEAAKASDTAPSFAYVFALVAAYVAISYAVGISFNRRLLRSAEATRATWRSKLYGFLDDENYRSLAEEPVAAAVRGYVTVERQTTCVIVVLVAGLLSFAAVEAGWLSQPWVTDVRGWTAHALSRVVAPPAR